jgi:hypothetical protein
VAEQLYKAGLEEKLKEGLHRIQKNYKIYDVTQPGIKKQIKEDVDALKAETSKPFPLKFDRDLGPLLDQMDAVFKKAAKSEVEAEKLSAERKLLADKILVIGAHYRGDVKKAGDALHFANYRIEPLLTEALMKIDGVTRTMAKYDHSDTRTAVDRLDYAPKWKDAKAKSELAYKKLIKDKNAVILLKSQKVTSYPFEFKDDFSTLLTRVYKDMGDMKRSSAESCEKALKVALKYSNEIAVTSKMLKKSLTGFERDVRDMVEPLTDMLDKITDDLKRYAERV